MIELVIPPRPRQLRSRPRAAVRQASDGGPFHFFDWMGPKDLAPGLIGATP